MTGNNQEETLTLQEVMSSVNNQLIEIRAGQVADPDLMEKVNKMVEDVNTLKLSYDMQQLNQFGVNNQQTGAMPKSLNLLQVVPKFSGLPEEKIQLFFEKFEAASQIGKWSEVDKLGALKLKLMDEASEFLNSDLDCVNATTYNEAKIALYNRFKTKNTVRFYRTQLLTLRMDKDESVEAFTDKIRKINYHTYELIPENAAAN